MDFKDILDAAKVQAILATLEQSELSVWRSIARTYSKTFCTPLHEVLEMNVEQVLLAVFEEQLEAVDLNEDLGELLEKIYELEDPEYESHKRDELNKFIKDAEKEEKLRIAEGRPIHKGLKDMQKETSLKDLEPKKQLPTSGGINFDYLQDSKNER